MWNNYSFWKRIVCTDTINPLSSPLARGALCILDSLLTKVLLCCCVCSHAAGCCGQVSMDDRDTTPKTLLTKPVRYFTVFIYLFIYLILIISLDKELQKCYKTYLCSGLWGFLCATLVAHRFLHFGQNKSVFVSLLPNVLKACVAIILFIIQHLNNFM